MRTRTRATVAAPLPLGPLLLAVLALILSLCPLPALSQSGGGGSGSCDDEAPLPSGPIKVALLSYCNAPAGTLPASPARNESGCAPDPFDVGLGAYDLGQEMYISAMRAHGFLPLKGGQRAQLEYTFVNLGFLDLTALLLSPASVLAQLGNSSAGLVHDAILTSNATFGGPYSFVLTPLTAPVQLVELLADMCEEGDRCIVVNSGATMRELHVCTPNAAAPTAGSLPEDCERRNRAPGERRFNNLFGVMYEASSVAASALEVYRSAGIRRLAILSEDGMMTSNSIQALKRTQQIARQLNLHVVRAEEMVPCNPLAVPSDCPQMPDGSTAAFAGQYLILPGGTSPDEYVRQLRAEGVEAVIFLASLFAGSLRSMAQVLESMHTQGWTPRALLLAGGGESTLATYMSDPDLALYAFTTTSWNPRLTGAEYQNYNSSTSFELFPAQGDKDAPAVFAQHFERYVRESGTGLVWQPESPSSFWSVIGFQALYVVQKLVETARSDDIHSLALASYRLSTPSAFHLLQFDVTGRTARVNDMLLQFRPRALGNKEGTEPVALLGFQHAHVLVYPYSIGESPVMPMPTWEERVFDPVQYAQPLEKMMAAFNTVCIAACLLLAALVLRHREHAVIRAATPSFCLLTIVGAIVMLTSNFFHTRVESDSHCAAQVWLLSLGFSMLFSALFIKTFRIWKIFFSSEKLSVVKMKDRDMMLAVAVFLLIDLVINATWSGMSGISSRIRVVDPFRPALNIVECDYEDSYGFLYAHVAIKGALLLFGICLTYAVRNTPSQFNESTYIGICIYNVSILICFIIPILASNIAGRENYLVRAFAVMFISLSTVCILYVPKFLSIRGAAKVGLNALDKLGGGGARERNASNGGASGGGGSKGAAGGGGGGANRSGNKSSGKSSGSAGVSGGTTAPGGSKDAAGAGMAMAAPAARYAPTTTTATAQMRRGTSQAGLLVSTASVASAAAEGSVTLHDSPAAPGAPALASPTHAPRHVILPRNSSDGLQSVLGSGSVVGVERAPSLLPQASFSGSAGNGSGNGSTVHPGNNLASTAPGAGAVSGAPIPPRHRPTYPSRNDARSGSFSRSRTGLTTPTPQQGTSYALHALPSFPDSSSLPGAVQNASQEA